MAEAAQLQHGQKRRHDLAAAGALAVERAERHAPPLAQLVNERAAFVAHAVDDALRRRHLQRIRRRRAAAREHRQPADFGSGSGGRER